MTTKLCITCFGTNYGTESLLKRKTNAGVFINFFPLPPSDGQILSQWNSTSPFNTKISL
jgi:hypothetical protein